MGYVRLSCVARTSLPLDISSALSAFEGLPWKEIAPWIGIAASLGFNVFNYRMSSAARQAGHRLDELKSIRVSIDAAFDEIGDKLSKVGALEVATFNRASHIKIVKETNKELAVSYIKAQDRISRLDDSQHCSGTEFLSKFETKWDLVTDRLDTLYKIGNDEVAFKRALKAVPEEWRNVRGELRGLIDLELTSAASGKAKPSNRL